MKCMKFLVAILSFYFSVLSAIGQNGISTLPDSTKKIIKAEVSCGQCKFGLPGKGCALAVRIKNKAYFVDGTGIDEHGDAHASDGFCNAVRKALVQGTIINNRFKATYFKLL